MRHADSIAYDFMTDEEIAEILEIEGVLEIDMPEYDSDFDDAFSDWAE